MDSALDWNCHGMHVFNQGVHGRHHTGNEQKNGSSEKCSDSGIDDEDEFATKFIYNNGNNASTDNITA